MDGRWSPVDAEHAQLVLDAPADHVFFREGDPADEMYFVLSGSVTIRKGVLELARIGPGSFFGEMSFLLGSDRTAGAVALAPCRCVRIHARNFDQLSREYPDTVRTMLVEMAARLRATSELARGGPAIPREADEIIAVP
jgi:CRP-like cAMP-binding protein